MVFWNVLDGLILALLAVCIVVWPTQLISDRTNRWLRIAAIVLVVLQIVVDGPRAQLVPAYLVATLFAILLVAHRPGQEESSKVRESKEGIFKKLVRWTLVCGTAVVLLISILFCLLFPRFEYPALLKKAGAFGPVETQRVYDITNRYVLAFFNKHLLGENEPLFDVTRSDYEEVSVLSKGGD
jgi:hypothetical protein